MTSPAIDRYGARLDREGYCIVPRAVPPAHIAALEAELAAAFADTPMSQGPFYGAHTRRFGALLRRSVRVEALVLHPTIIAIVEQQLLPWCDRIALNLTQAIEIHPGAPAQLPHRDQDMWPGPKGMFEYLINVMWPLTAFTPDNGGTRLWPQSHVDQDVPLLPEAEAIVPAVIPGDALIFLGSTLHGGGGHSATSPRRGIIISYALGWLKPFELQWLVYPPSVARGFSSDLAALVGYAQHRPNLGNVEGRCPSILLGGQLSEPIGAIDALRPDQADAVMRYFRDQQVEL